MPRATPAYHAAYQMPPPSSHFNAAPAPAPEAHQAIQAPRNLKVVCVMGVGGATANVTWEAVWPEVRGCQVVYEVQMIVRWISGQTWNTIYTVAETSCSVKGLKQSHPFAVRVRAIGVGGASGPDSTNSTHSTHSNWVTDYTAPFEFVTEASQHRPIALPQMPAQHKAFQDWNFTTEAAGYQPATGASSYEAASYLERVMQARQEKVDIEERQHQLDMQQLARNENAIQIAQQVQRRAAQVPPLALGVQKAPDFVTGEMADTMALDLGNVTARGIQEDRTSAPYRSVGQILHVQPASTEPLQHASQPVPQVQMQKEPTVRRITLNDPANPHHGMMQQMQLEAKQAAKSYQDHCNHNKITPIKTYQHHSNPTFSHPPTTVNAYASQPRAFVNSPQALPSTTFASQPRVASNTSLPYASQAHTWVEKSEEHVTSTPRQYAKDRTEATSDTGTQHGINVAPHHTLPSREAAGPLARALGVTQYETDRNVEETMMVRIVNRDFVSAHTVPVLSMQGVMPVRVMPVLGSSIGGGRRIIA